MPQARKSSWYMVPSALVGGAAVIGLIGVTIHVNVSGDMRQPRFTGAGVGAGQLVRTEPLAIPQRSDQLVAQEGSSGAPANVLPEFANILAAGSGGRLVVADNDSWLKSIDENENTEAVFRAGKSSPVYAFRNRQTATFDTFRIFIGRTGATNVKAFELLAGDESPNGPFRAVGRFQTENARYAGDPYQEFHFPSTTAKFLKVRVLSSWGQGDGYVQEIQLLGKVDAPEKLSYVQD